MLEDVRELLLKVCIVDVNYRDYSNHALDTRSSFGKSLPGGTGSF